MLFGKKQPEGKTYLLLDIENGSVGAGLLRRDFANHGLKLFGETRTHLPLLHTRDSHSLLREVKKGLQTALQHVSEVASRLRGASAAGAHELGTISNAQVYLSAPWGRPNLAAGSPIFEEPLIKLVAQAIEESLGDIPHTLISGAGAVTAASKQLLPYDENYLLCFVSGEVTELVLVSGGAVVGYATMPVGRHMSLRTLHTHAGLSSIEARSALRAGAQHINEPLAAAAELFAEQLADTVAPLLKMGKVDSVYVVSVEAGEWIAKSLAQSQVISELFPRGGTVRALRQEHVMPYLSAHAERPDLMLMLESLATK